MGSVGINFGSATSGAGFDVASTVSSIMALERTPETAWANQTTALQAQDTALTALGSNASALSTALSSLTSFDGVFSKMQGASSDLSAVALTSVGSTAQSGTHTLAVAQLATTAQQYSSQIATSARLSGSLSLHTSGASAATTISIAPGSSLGDVAAQINSSGAGVQAAVLSDSSGQYLSLTSKQSGAAGDLTVTSSMQDAGGNAVSFSVAQTGIDAKYKLDGVNLTSSSNTVTGALPGVSFQLTGLSSNVTVQVAPDESGIESALQTFISAYNTLSKSLTAQEGKDSSGNAEPLYGSTVVSQIQSTLSSAFATQPSGTNAGLSLTSLGLSLGVDGTLSLDTGVLGAALASNFSGVADSFMVVGGFGQTFSAALNSIGSSTTGTISMALANNSSAEATLADNKTTLEARLTAYSANLTTELNTANQVLQAIPQQLNEVDQMFYSISGYQSGSSH
ncbi:flagellar filament capping protein FliD [Terriglobus aquaticus]|uniref:Flagellar hook-associated protein 2 n=1 Tax=Terriglobus aquaticus TaxID=940139 RepID=A0ABW9KL34_9BACT|nr:flagellar filament capping protein FliD [Terriglobus aquaticus]